MNHSLELSDLPRAGREKQFLSLLVPFARALGRPMLSE